MIEEAHGVAKEAAVPDASVPGQPVEPSQPPRLDAPKGTFDYLPPDAAARAEVVEAMISEAELAGYGRVETPMFEDTAVFARGVGGSTDIVQKEMYSFSDRSGRRLTLRPEHTAGVVRALIEHGRIGNGLSKVVYAGPNFRYERPQAGRQRQFFQVGIEALGVEDPVLDAEVIVVGHEIFRRLGVSVTLRLTTLGCAVCRPPYVARLRAWLDSLGEQLPAEARRRSALNPLRVLDSKDPVVQSATADAPLLRAQLCAACTAHFDAVTGLLNSADVAYVEDPRLVRGLDYYVRTTFEWQADRLDAAQNALGGGGRYDGLSQLLGGPAAPGVGWALGLDRTMLARRASGCAPPAAAAVDALVVRVSEDSTQAAFGCALQLRRAGISADISYGARSLRGQMKAAARRGARTVVFFGAEEIAAGEATVRDMRSGTQTRVAQDQVAEVVAATLAVHGGMPPAAGDRLAEPPGSQPPGSQPPGSQTPGSETREKGTA